MFLTNKLSFPYKEGTLDGVFKVGIRTELLKINYELKLSSIYPSTDNYSAYMCFDGDSETFCHTEVDVLDPQYLQIHFKDIRFKIEGFALQNRNTTGWDPYRYEIQGSNDGLRFATIQSFNENNNTVCGAAKIRTNRIETTNSYKYFRLTTAGRPCFYTQETYMFNIAEFDLFGSFLLNKCTIAIRDRCHAINLIYYYIILIYSS